MRRPASTNDVKEKQNELESIKVVTFPDSGMLWMGPLAFREPLYGVYVRFLLSKCAEPLNMS